MKALNGITVLDFSTMLSGPSGSMMLADLGANVIKIEKPGGDVTRITPPNFHKDLSLYYMAYNRNKRSVGLNMTTEEGRNIFYEMVKHADVVWDNYRPGVKEKLGLGYETLSKINPRIICASITGFGSNNPEGRGRPTFDLAIQAMSGMISMTGEPDAMPVKLGLPLADIGSGWHGVVGVLAALIQRERTGKGQIVDISMLDSLTSLHGYEAAFCLFNGNVPQRLGTRHRGYVPYRVFATSDGNIAIVSGHDNFWNLLYPALGLPDEFGQKYPTMQDRLENREIVENAIQERLLTNTSAYWLQIIEDAGVPCGNVNNLKEALEEPALLARNMVISVDHLGEPVRLLGNPVKLSDSEDSYTCPPEMGQDTDQVMREYCHLSNEQIAELRRQNIIY